MMSKQIQRRHSRRALLWGAAFFACSQLALALFMERGHPELIDPEYGTRLHFLRAQLAADPGRPLVLVLGSSRTAMGFRPDALPSLASSNEKAPLIFNYSLVGAGPMTQLLVLNRLLDQGIRPDHVLIEVWQPPLSYSEDGRIQRDRGLMGSDLSVVARYFRQPWPVYRQYARAQLLSGYVYRHQVQKEFLPLRLPSEDNPGSYYWRAVDRSGWLPCPWPRWSAGEYPTFEAKERVRWSVFLKQFKLNNDTDKALRDLLVLCQRRQIGAALLVMPESSDFRGYYSEESRVAFAGYVASLGRDHVVPCIDARAWLANEDFVDGVHLTQDGARHLTERFGREVMPPLLAGALSGGT